MDARLAAVLDDVGPDRWAAFALDADDRLVWVSRELKLLLDEPDERRLGVGRHIVLALLDPV